MEIIGKIKKVCPLIQGETVAGVWSKRDVVVATAGDDSHDVAVTFFGDRRVDKLRDVNEGDMVQVFATVKSRCADDQGDKWFTTVDASTIVVLQRQQQQPQPPVD